MAAVIKVYLVITMTRLIGDLQIQCQCSRLVDHCRLSGSMRPIKTLHRLFGNHRLPIAA